MKPLRSNQFDATFAVAYWCLYHSIGIVASHYGTSCNRANAEGFGHLQSLMTDYLSFRDN